MDRLYQKTFDQVALPEDRADSIRTVLASRCSRMETEANMKHTFLRRPTAVLAAVLLIGSLSVTAFAYGGRVVERVYTFMTGGTIEQSVDENGTGLSGVSIGTEQSPLEIREDGTIWLMVNGEALDITGEFSYTDPYIYDGTGEDGLRHVLVVGGETDAIGWSEFLWDENGLPAGGTSQLATPAGREDAPWLEAALETLDLPW